MALGNLNTADFIKGEGVSQSGNVITITQSSGGSTQSGFVGRPTAVWSSIGLIFNVFTPQYYIGGILYPSATSTLTLDAADPTNGRFDVIAVDSTGPIKITGVASADPVKPTVDSLTQLEITTIFVAAGATEPTLISDLTIYKENVEWVGSSDVAGASFIDAVSPFAGTKAVSIGSFTNGKYVKFVDSSNHDITDYGFLKFYVKLKAQFSNTAGFIIRFKKSGSIVSSSFTVTNGIYDFDRNDVLGYQLIVIPISEFTFTTNLFDELYFELKGSNGSGFYFDNVGLQGGLSSVGDKQNAITNISTDNGTAISDQPNDNFNVLGKGGSVVTALGKTIFIEGLAGGVASDTDTYTITITGITAYVADMAFKVRFTNANTGSATLNVNGLGAKTLKKNVSTNLSAGDINAGQVFVVVYDGTYFQVIGLGGGGGGSGTVNAGTQYRIAYYATTGTAVSEAPAITASRALKSDANGVPTHFDTATEPSLTELSYVKGVTSAIQTQLDSKLSAASVKYLQATAAFINQTMW